MTLNLQRQLFNFSLRYYLQKERERKKEREREREREGGREREREEGGERERGWGGVGWEFNCIDIGGNKIQCLPFSLIIHFLAQVESTTLSMPVRVNKTRKINLYLEEILEQTGIE